MQLLLAQIGISTVAVSIMPGRQRLPGQVLTTVEAERVLPARLTIGAPLHLVTIIRLLRAVLTIARAEVLRLRGVSIPARAELLARAALPEVLSTGAVHQAALPVQPEAAVVVDARALAVEKNNQLS